MNKLRSTADKAHEVIHDQRSNYWTAGWSTCLVFSIIGVMVGSALVPLGATIVMGVMFSVFALWGESRNGTDELG